MYTLSEMRVVLRTSTSAPEAPLSLTLMACSKDALRSIIISQRLLGTREIAVFHHTGCGMLTFSTNDLRGILKKAHPGDAAVASLADSIDFLEFGHLEDSVKSDVAFLRENPLVLTESIITGWVYEVETGKVCDRQSGKPRLGH